MPSHAAAGSYSGILNNCCRFKEAKHKNTELETLKAAIRAQLEKLIRLNRTRMDFGETFERLIESMKPVRYIGKSGV